MVHAAQVKEGQVKINGGFQMVQPFAESQTKERKTAQLCANAQIGAFDLASRDVTGIQISADWDGDCGFYLRGVVRVRRFAVRASGQFEKLGKISTGSEVFFNSRNASAQSVRRNLESFGNSLAEITNKGVGG